MPENMNAMNDARAWIDYANGHADWVHSSEPMVMISYAGKDGRWIEMIHEHFDQALEDVWDERARSGYTIWDFGDRRSGTEIGGHFPTIVAEKMWSCRCAIIVWSTKYINSKFCRDIELPFLLWRRHHHKIEIYIIRVGETPLDDKLWLFPDAPAPVNLTEIVDDRNPKLNSAKAASKYIDELEEAARDRRLTAIARAICKQVKSRIPDFYRHLDTREQAENAAREKAEREAAAKAAHEAAEAENILDAEAEKIVAAVEVIIKEATDNNREDATSQALQAVEDALAGKTEQANVGTEQAAVDTDLCDPVTGFITGGVLIRRLEATLVSVRVGVSRASRPSLILVDIDDFQQLSENVGIHAAQSILLVIARRLSRILRPGDEAAKISEGCFALVINSEHGKNRIMALADFVRRAVSTPINYSEREIFLRGSVGVAFIDEITLNDHVGFLRNAGLALAQAKRKGGDNVEMYHPSMRRVSLWDSLKKALLGD